MRRRPRVGYDTIAHLYDAQPHRARTADRQLLAYAEAHEGARLAVLDIGCGTGNQLIADHDALPNIWYAGLDRSLGMTNEARRKAPDLAWVQGDAAALPFGAERFDFICSQIAFHHVDDKAGMLREVLGLLRPHGRFVLHDMCPQQSQDWLYYEYFPEARLRDFEDFWPRETICKYIKTAGFAVVNATYQRIEFDEDLPAWLDIVRRRDTCSQLQAISAAAYRQGVRRLKRDIADPKLPRSRKNRLCLVTIRGDKPEPVR